MATDIRLKEGLPEITERIVETYKECGRINHLGHTPLPSREAVVEILADLCEILYPGYGRRQNLHMGNVEYHVGDLIDGLHDRLTQQIARALRHELRRPRRPRRRLRGPGPAEGDRAAGAAARRCATCSSRTSQAAYRRRPGREEPSRDHLLLPRPGGDHRLPHRPRAAAAGRAADPADDDRVRPLARPASTSTPAPRIGPGFFIDHGTGVVIGETCDIGEQREALPGRDARRPQLPARRRRQHHPRHEAAPDARGRRRRLRQRHDPRRRDGRSATTP